MAQILAAQGQKMVKEGKPLEGGVYLHVSSEGKEDRVVITGLLDAGSDGENVLLVVWATTQSACVMNAALSTTSSKEASK